MMSDQVNILLEWCAANSVTLDTRISIESNESSEISVYSKDTFIPDKTTLVKIPKDSVLSIRTCSLASFIPAIPYGLGAQLSLSLALLGEILRGERSKWCGYIKSLPLKIVNLPMFWELNICGSLDSSEALSWIRGTEAGKLSYAPSENGITILEEIKRYYRDVAEPLLLRHSDVWQCAESSPFPELRMFYYTFSMVSSRAFLVDAYHGLAMVPIADAFNHITEHYVHLESDYNVCPECGALHECVHDKESISLVGGGNPPLRTPIGYDDDHDLFFEMVSNLVIPPFSEIFNTYGEGLTNAQLLNQYGFILDVNDNDRLYWNTEEILHLVLPEDFMKINNGNTIHQFGEISTLLQDANLNPLFSESNLVFCEDFIDKNNFSINGEGALSQDLWILLFVLAVRRYPVPSGAGFRLELFSVLELQIRLESVDEDDENEDSFSADETDIRRLRILSSIAGVVVDLCKDRKLRSGKDGSEDIDLWNVIEDTPSENVCTQLALSFLMSERSILDSCAVAWDSLADSIKAILCRSRLLTESST